MVLDTTLTDLQPVQMTWSDAWFLASLAIITVQDRWVPLRHVVDRMDFSERLSPTYDEISYGLPRLRAAGLIDTKGEGRRLRVRVTTAARRLRIGPNASTRSASQLLESVRRAIGASGRRDRDEDRTQGSPCRARPGLVAWSDGIPGHGYRSVTTNERVSGPSVPPRVGTVAAARIRSLEDSTLIVVVIEPHPTRLVDAQRG